MSWLSNKEKNIAFKPPTHGDAVLVSKASMQHHLHYIGRTGGFKNPDGSNRVPTPQEVVDLGWEPKEYLERFVSIKS